MLLILIVFTFIPASGFAAETSGVDSKNYDWNPVMDAIVQVESHGNNRAKRGSSVGAMQITPILVVECNQILKRRKSKRDISYLIDSVFRNRRKCSYLYSRIIILSII